MGRCRVLSVGFLNCRGWWSREVDVMCVLKSKSFDLLGQAKIFQQQEGEADIPGYVWYGHNRARDKHASGGVGLLVNEH